MPSDFPLEETIMPKQGYREAARTTPSSPARAEVTKPRHKEGPAGDAKTDEKTKIKSASRYEERGQAQGFFSRVAQLFRG